jgi:hypothetical protein
MIDFNNILATPGVDIQYFTGQGNSPLIGSIGTVTLATGGVVTVPSANYKIGDAIYITGTFTAGSITGYTSGTTYYVIAVASMTSITISDTLGGAAVTSTAGTITPGATVWNAVTQWQTWRKPRGVKNVFMIGVGGGSSGAVGANTAASNAGGAGGGSGAQTNVWLPAMFLPDILYIQCGTGGQQPSTLVSAALQVGGGTTIVSIEPSYILGAQLIVLEALGGTGGGTVAGAAVTINNMPLAGRGFYSFYAGQAGTAGGATQTAGTAVAFPVTGIMVMGGAGGGGSGAAPGAGGGQTQPANYFGSDYYTPTTTGGAAAAGATPARPGNPGLVVPFYLMNYGGAGGGGASTTAGGLAGAGGNGAPGSGGGGSGGAGTVNTTLGRPGNGGAGFVIIVSW